MTEESTAGLGAKTVQGGVDVGEMRGISNCSLKILSFILELLLAHKETRFGLLPLAKLP